MGVRRASIALTAVAALANATEEPAGAGCAASARAFDGERKFSNARWKGAVGSLKAVASSCSVLEVEEAVLVPDERAMSGVGICA